jgi:hypothetical protein
MTSYPDAEWMDQQTRNVTLEDWGFLKGCGYLLHDRDAALLPCSDWAAC